MVSAAFLTGALFSGLIMAGFLVARKAWHKAFGTPPPPLRSDAQKANERYYEQVVGSRPEWRSAPLRRRVQRNVSRRIRDQQPPNF